MDTITIKSQYTDLRKNLMFWAIEKGWKEKISVEEEFEDADSRGVVGIYTRIVEKDNPITLDKFIKNTIESILLREISEPISRYVDNEAKEQADLKKSEYLEAFNNNLIIEIQ